MKLLKEELYSFSKKFDLEIDVEFLVNSVLEKFKEGKYKDDDYKSILENCVEKPLKEQSNKIRDKGINMLQGIRWVKKANLLCDDDDDVLKITEIDSEKAFGNNKEKKKSLML